MNIADLRRLAVTIFGAFMLVGAPGALAWHDIGGGTLSLQSQCTLSLQSQ